MTYITQITLFRVKTESSLIINFKKPILDSDLAVLMTKDYPGWSLMAMVYVKVER